MPKRSGKAKVVPLHQERDVNVIATSVIARTLELTEGTGGRDPAAVALGRRGGLKGGRARAAKLTPEQRRTSALKAAQARWSKRKTKG